MRLWIALLAVSLTASSALSQTASPPSLDDGTKRQVLRQLYELEAAREQLRAYQDYVARDREADDRERANWLKSLELEKKAVALALQEGRLAEERAQFYETAYRAVTKKRGIGCILKTIFTLGIARCR